MAEVCICSRIVFSSAALPAFTAIVVVGIRVVIESGSGRDVLATAVEGIGVLGTSAVAEIFASKRRKSFDFRVALGCATSFTAFLLGAALKAVSTLADPAAVSLAADAGTMCFVAALVSSFIFALLKVSSDFTSFDVVMFSTESRTFEANSNGSQQMERLNAP